jgi:heme/copper-type cytochrome/quinol oxidase subunit 2
MVPTLNIDVQVAKSGAEPTVVEFVARPPGRLEIACSEFCGSGHGHMKAALISIDPLYDNNQGNRRPYHEKIRCS